MLGKPESDIQSVSQRLTDMRYSFMYGANSLVWQGVQNATIGTVYTEQYGFSTAGVAAAYVGGVIGTFVG